LFFVVVSLRLLCDHCGSAVSFALFRDSWIVVSRGTGDADAEKAEEAQRVFGKNKTRLKEM